MCTVPVRNFRSKSPEVPKAQDAPLEGALADPSPFQVMLAVLRAARPRRHRQATPIKIPAASRNSLSALSSSRIGMEIGLSSFLTLTHACLTPSRSLVEG